GNYMAEEGNYPGALAQYLKACELEPGEAVYHFGMGELLATFRDKFIADGAFSDEGIDAEILSAFAKAAALDPSNKDFAFRHAEAYYDISSPKWSEALAEWTKIASRSDLTRYEKDAARLHLARVNCELGRNAEALALVRDDVVPVLQATRARLLRRISLVNTASEDRANASAVLPPEQRPAQSAGNAVLPDAPSSAINAAEKSGGQ
ncbi:MAG TPA: hypothetical protein PKI32_08000, partial [Opitutales bacterium]|nr:hypothetical protein [Opitutales bacterium]